MKSIQKQGAVAGGIAWFFAFPIVLFIMVFFVIGVGALTVKQNPSNEVSIDAAQQRLDIQDSLVDFLDEEISFNGDVILRRDLISLYLETEDGVALSRLRSNFLGAFPNVPIEDGRSQFSAECYRLKGSASEETLFSIETMPQQTYYGGGIPDACPSVNRGELIITFSEGRAAILELCKGRCSEE